MTEATVQPTTTTESQAEAIGQPPIELDHNSPQKMIALLRIFCKRLGSGGILPTMLTSMMPLAENAINKIEAQNMQALAMVLAESFLKVGDPSVTPTEFDAWAARLAE